MKIQLKTFEPSLGQYIFSEMEINLSFKSMVESVTDLPTTDIANYDAVMVRDTKHIFIYINGQWIDQGVYDVQDLLIEKLMQSLS
jgi:hypothetical protein